jgi:hypothetical protein
VTDDPEPAAPAAAPIDDPETAAVAAAPRPSRARRIWAGALLWLAGLFIILSIHAIFVNRLVLDADTWAQTSTKVISDQAVRTQVSAFLVNQLYAQTDVTAQVHKALPPRLKPLAGPIAGGLREVGQKAVYTLLGLPAAQTIWRRANRQAIRQFDNIVEEKKGVVTSHGDAIILDVRPVLVEVANRLGLPQSVVQSVPPNAGRITIVSSNHVKQIKGAVKLLRGLTIILPAIAFLLVAGAIWLSEGRRRHALLLTGVAMVAAGLFVVIERNVLGHQIIGKLVSDPATQQAAHNAYSIMTELFTQIAQSVLLFGLVIMLCAALAGPRHWAVTVRRAAAPWLRERIAICLTGVAALFGLLVLWAPVPALRIPIPALIILALLLAGVLVLRREATAEFPDARIGDTEAAIRARWRSRGAASRPADG